MYLEPRARAHTHVITRALRAATRALRTVGAGKLRSPSHRVVKLLLQIPSQQHANDNVSALSNTEALATPIVARGRILGACHTTPVIDPSAKACGVHMHRAIAAMLQRTNTQMAPPLGHQLAHGPRLVVVSLYGRPHHAAATVPAPTREWLCVRSDTGGRVEGGALHRSTTTNRIRCAAIHVTLHSCGAALLLRRKHTSQLVHCLHTNTNRGR